MKISSNNLVGSFFHSALLASCTCWTLAFHCYQGTLLFSRWTQKIVWWACQSENLRISTWARGWQKWKTYKEMSYFTWTTLCPNLRILSRLGSELCRIVVSWGTNSNPTCSDNPRDIFFSQCCFEKFRLSVSEANVKKRQYGQTSHLQIKHAELSLCWSKKSLH